MNLLSSAQHQHTAFTGALHEFFFRERAKYWLARLYLCCSLLVSVWIAFNSPWNLQRAILDVVGEGGWLLLSSVAVFALCGIFDVIINDLLPVRYSMRWAEERRHQVYMILALMLMSMVYINVTKGSSTVLILRYSVESTFCAGIAIFDTIARVQQVRAAQAR